MATMNIKDPEVRRLAERLAERRGVSMTAAVRQALQESLDRDRANDDTYVERMSALASEFTKRYDDPFLTDEELYDEWGLPK